MTRRITNRRGVLIAVVAAVLATLVVLALTLGGGPGPGTAEPPAAQPVAVAPEPQADSPEAVAALPKSEPVSIDIPKIGAHSSLVPLGLNPDNTVEVPPVTTPLQAGWYTYAPTPGEVGPAVVLGHVDGNHQKGIFFRLKELAAGDRVSIARKDGTTAVFEVTKVHQVPKKDFEAEGVYDDTAGPELRLITCGGVFDRSAHNYVDNIVVYARLVQA
ncbi:MULTISPECIES: class F sortase [unclassified Amycolatopsis]|uniref:class F sortase n=1 Tax=unclassified Amycolatopsis TaxID=2618356 RepID=UPI00287414A4|nr:MULTISPECIES: class F sortase [unclassified Amycolatopsis]MDS0135210.1 class F sortase [Amycolatopsis sp. 505]MDS0143013.1 class F sortase [Amycolatopsis sp. CM201R]